LETGSLPEEEFEPRFASMLGVDAPNLIDRMFAGSAPDRSMQAAVRRRNGDRPPHVEAKATIAELERLLRVALR
jgi:hypothetical protein